MNSVHKEVKNSEYFIALVGFLDRGRAVKATYILMSLLRFELFRFAHQSKHFWRVTINTTFIPKLKTVDYFYTFNFINSKLSRNTNYRLLLNSKVLFTKLNREHTSKGGHK